jgi:RNA polymerase sigma-70 factor (ECF subfamily)
MISNEDPIGGAPLATLSDRSLLRRLRHGSQDAATQLYLRYAHCLKELAKARCSTDLARRVDVDDIVQSVFGSFFRAVSLGCYDVPAGEELWGLFHAIALNKIRAKGAFHRAAKRDVRATIGGDALELAEAAAHENDASYAVLLMTIEEALQALPPQHRTMLQLRIEGYEIAEIARETGRSKRTVERILQETREALRRRLGEGD